MMLNFVDRFVKLNILPDFHHLHFSNGTRYKDSIKWWAPEENRSIIHEGVDIVQYVDKNNSIQQMKGLINICPLFMGKYWLSIPDFLGTTTVIKHPQILKNNSTLYSLYAHLDKIPSTNKNTSITERDIIGSISFDKQTKTPQHLHISCCWIDNSFEFSMFDWNIITKSTLFELIDPMPLILSSNIYDK